MNIEHTARSLRWRMREAKTALLNPEPSVPSLHYELEAAYELMGQAAVELETLDTRIKNLLSQ